MSVLCLMISSIVFQIIRYCFIFSLFYDETTWQYLLHVCVMMIIIVFSVIDDDQLDGLSYVFSYGYLSHTTCVWCVCIFSLCMTFLMWLRKGVVVTCQLGSTQCTTSCHCLFSLEYMCLYMRGFYADCRYWVSTSLNCQDERTLLQYLNGKRGEINS